MSTLQSTLETYLADHKSMVISGPLPDGTPYAATTCYTKGDGMTLHFFVFKGSEKHQLVTGGKPFTLVIDDGFQIPFQGLELRGTAQVLEGDAAKPAQESLATTFPKLNNVWGHPAVLVCAFTPQRALWHDWNIKVGHTEPWTAG